MGIQDRRSPEAGAAAGDKPDDRSTMSDKTLEECTENHKKTSGSDRRHESFMQEFSAALNTGDTGLWVSVKQAGKELLTEEERAQWAFAGLRSLDPDMREITIEHAWLDADRPPPLQHEDVVSEARLRAVATTTREHKATMAATWDVLGESDRQGFLSRVVGREGFLRFIGRANPGTLDVLFLAVSRAMAPARCRELVDYITKGNRDGA